MNTDQSPVLQNRHERRRLMSGANPHHNKLGREWRKKAWQWGMRHPKLRTLGVVDESAVKIESYPGHSRKVTPIAVMPLAKDQATARSRVRKPPQHTRAT